LKENVSRHFEILIRNFAQKIMVGFGSQNQQETIGLEFDAIFWVKQNCSTYGIILLWMPINQSL